MAAAIATAAGKAFSIESRVRIGRSKRLLPAVQSPGAMAATDGSGGRRLRRPDALREMSVCDRDSRMAGDRRRSHPRRAARFRAR
ncbi:MAG: hypothetical protein OEW88_00120 [Gammaproteobacteria bacterium]|nr:hypothetical protein [Gammaproteobacteria bacterium]